MVNKLEIYGHNGNKQILYFSSEQALKDARQIKDIMGSPGGWAMLSLADYVIELDDANLPPTETLIKCRYPGGLEGIMDQFMDMKNDRK